MSRRAFRIAYDGRPYYGFQRQPDVPTVEGVLFDTLDRLGVHDPDDHRPSGYAAAGRTDAGVSALAQTVALDAPEWLTPRAFNSGLPGEIRAWASAEAPAEFHATHDATRREYVYHLYAPASDDAGADPELGGSVGGGVDDDRVRAALDALSGEHDFDRLTPDDRLTERRIEASATREGDFLAVRVAADGFPRGLVRRLVTLARAVGTGDADLARVESLLGDGPIRGREGVAAAPATPLVLTDVSYPDLDFTADEDAAESAREAFGERHVEGRVAGRVAGAIRMGIRDGAPAAEGDTETH
ncbi:tRNA pseudouridine(38-40) synthase TruA [Halobium salinum]|uniref:tRNA pseudouridine synthase A n=1 Tax=Halobium salinum TaxID=1364940 RepID=A0ABD5PFG2_9EURY|nr:tRNA pseudouridine(38-40) synthase TruA [Halobium salinum]